MGLQLRGRGKLLTVIVTLMMVSAVFTTVPITGQATSDSFSEPFQINHDLQFTNQRAPDVAVSEDNISVVWEADSSTDLPRVVYAQSSDNGSTFTDEVVVGPEEHGAQSDPALAVNSTGTVFVVWTDDRSGQNRIFFSRSDDGSNFTDGKAIVTSPGGEQSLPDIAFANGTLYIVWAESIGGDRDIFLSKSNDNGTTFQPPQRIDDTGTENLIQNFPSVAASDSEVFVVWHDSRVSDLLSIYGAFSNDSGESFAADVKVSDGSTLERHERPQAGIVSGHPCAVWQDNRGGDWGIRFSKSMDNATSFQSSVAVSDGPEDSDQTSPSMASDASDRIMVTFVDDRSGGDRVYFSMSRDVGSTFTTSMEVSDAADARQVEPALAVSPYGTPLVVFAQEINDNWDIMFTSLINEPPTCSISYPSPGAEVQDEIVITGNASDPEGDLAHLEVNVRISQMGGGFDSGWQEAYGKDPWSFEFNTSTVINGQYVLQAQSFDGEAYSELVKVYVVVSNEEQPFPDLQILPANITASTDKIEMGSRMTINADIYNTGNVSAYAVKVNFYRGNILLDETTLSRIDADQKKTVSFVWSPLEGYHTLTIEVDPADAIYEIREDNNKASKQFSVKPAGYYRPDLQVSPFNISVTPDGLVKGDVANITVSVFNNGTVNASNVAVLVKVDGVNLTRGTVSLIPMGNSSQFLCSWTAELGEHTIKVIIDPDNQTSELNKTNNQAEVTVDVSVDEAFPGWYVALAVALILAGAGVAVYFFRWRK